MICANLWLFTMAGGLGVLAFLNRISPIAILSTVFLAGVGFAVNGPSWTASIPEIVEDDELMVQRRPPSGHCLTKYFTESKSEKNLFGV